MTVCTGSCEPAIVPLVTEATAVANELGSVEIGDTAGALNRAQRPGVVNGLGVWWRKLGVDGSNVNELTSQKLTDIGRAPTFYDCLVEVSAA